MATFICVLATPIQDLKPPEGPRDRNGHLVPMEFRAVPVEHIGTPKEGQFERRFRVDLFSIGPTLKDPPWSQYADEDRGRQLLAYVQDKLRERWDPADRVVNLEVDLSGLPPYTADNVDVAFEISDGGGQIGFAEQ